MTSTTTARRRLSLLVALGLLHACGPERAAVGSGPPGTPVRLSTAPRLSVGVLEGDTLEELHEVVTPFLLPNGNLVVPLAGSHAIRVFEPDGRFAGSLGGRGAGPGEFMSLRAAWPRGDTIEAFDDELLRITRFAPDGTTATTPLDPVPSAQAAIPGVFAEGWAFYGVQSARPGTRDAMRVHRFSRTGEHMGAVAALEGMARFEAGNFRGPTPLSPRWFVALHGGELFLSESLTPRIDVIDVLGDTVREIVWEPEPSPPVEGVLRAVIDSAAPPSRAGTSDSGPRARLEAAPAPDRLSVFWGLIVDEEGFVWVRPFEPLENAAALGGLRGHGSGGEWMIFSREGERVGRVALPDDLEPVRITSDAVIGIRRDALGVESVQVYALERS